MNSEEARSEIIRKLVKRGFSHTVQEGAVVGKEVKGFEMSRATYSSMYGPTTGDRVRLADTDLWIEVEKDMTVYGDELKFGGGTLEQIFLVEFVPIFYPGSIGKVIREGMGQATGLPDSETLDLVITNALIIDWNGIYKASRQV